MSDSEEHLLPVKQAVGGYDLTLDEAIWLLNRWNLAASHAGFTGPEYINDPELVFDRVSDRLLRLGQLFMERGRMRNALLAILERIEEAQDSGVWCDQGSVHPDPERIKLDGFIEDVIREVLNGSSN